MDNQFSAKSSVLALTTILLIFFPFLHFSSVNIGKESFDGSLFGTFAAGSISVLVALVVVLVLAAKMAAPKLPVKRVLSVFYAGYLCLFLYSTMHPLFANIVFPLFGRGADLSYAFTVLAVMGLAFWLSKFNAFHLAIFVFVLTLTTFSAIRFASHIPPAENETAITPSVSETSKLVPAGTGSINGVLPNVYFIIVDGYTSLAVLQEVLDYDNQAFIREMEKQGFVHQNENFSAYTSTSLSLAAMMQGEYPVTEDSPRYSTTHNFYPSLLQHSEPPAAVKQAKALGYTVRLFGNSWAECAPMHLKCPSSQDSILTSYEVLTFLELTPISWVRENTGFLNLHQTIEEGSDAIGRFLRYAKRRGNKDGPYFTFIHHLPPHPPYIYNPDCTVRKNIAYDFTSWSEGAKPYYLDNLQCTNKKLKELSTYINNEDPGAIVVIQADHGTAFEVDWTVVPDEWSDLQIRERLSILSLIRAPENCHQWLLPQLNTVNAVRFVFGCIVGEKPKYLCNDSFISLYRPFPNPDYGHVHRITPEDIRNPDLCFDN